MNKNGVFFWRETFICRKPQRLNIYKGEEVSVELKKVREKWLKWKGRGGPEAAVRNLGAKRRLVDDINMSAMLIFHISGQFFNSE